ncbi:MAG TPA: gluconokinase [Planctomycetota bacterium]|nr:gluconokinase [Planctomycetota bacterium]
MGVSGSGKTTVGRELAQRMGWQFLEGDEFHPAENVGRMRRGVPLEDEDREGWLRALAVELEKVRQRGESAVVACSALKRAYRRILGVGREDVALVHLAGPRELIRGRLGRREGHFMPAELLESQLEALEPPGREEAALALDVREPPEELAERAAAWLRERANR